MQSFLRWLALSSAVAGYVPAVALSAQSTATRSAIAPVSGVEMASPSTLAPFRAGDRFFSVAAAGALQVRDGDKGAPRDLLPAGTFSVVAPSPNGRYVAYTVGPAHPAPYDVRIRDVQTGMDLPDVLHDSRISPAPWSHDNKGFLYVREEVPGGRQRVYYHGLGRAPEKDALILTQFDHPEWRYSARVSDDGNYAVFTISYPADDHTRIYFIDLADPGKPNFGAPVVKLAQAFDARYEFVDNAGSYFFLQTNRGAPQGQILLANTDVIRETRWPALIRQTDDSLLFARTAGDEYLVAVYRTGAGASIAKVLGPEDPAVLRQEIRDRIDSLKKAREKRDDSRPVREVGSRGFMGNGPAIRLEPRSDVPIPAGATIVAMNSIADQEQLFYTVRLSDGTTKSFVYDVKNGHNDPYQPSPSSR
jgi:prolyl oligopeptidase